MPTVPQLKSCCFCATTETGTKIIGWLSTIVGALETLGYLMDLIKILPRLGKEVSGSDVFAVAVMIALAALFTLLGLYLLLGVYKGNQAYVRLWVNVTVIFLIIQVIFFVIRIVLMITGRGSFDILVNILNLVFLIYCILVVNSYLREQGTGIEAF